LTAAAILSKSSLFPDCLKPKNLETPD